MGKIVDVGPQGGEKWHAWRSWKIGSSHASTIMGVNPYKTKLQLWKELVLAEQVEENDDMRRGKRLEPIARNKLNLEMDTRYEPVCMEHDIYPCIIASFDGYDPLAPVQVAEIKCPRDLSKALSGEVPEMYFPQCQHLMMVANAPSCVYNAFTEDGSVSIVVGRDDEYCEKLLKAELEFYSSMINYRPPTPEGYTKIEDETKERWSKLYTDIGILIDNFQEIRDDIRERLIDACDGVDSIIGNLKLCRIEKKGSIDYEKIELLKTIDLEQYRKPPSVSWRLALMKEE